MHTIPYPVFCGFVLLAYFLPTITAFVREHRRLGWICLANITVGWTVLGWALVALWAMSSRRHHHHRAVRKRHPVPEPAADQDPEIAQTNAEYRRAATVIGRRTMARRGVIMPSEDTAAAPYKAALEEEYAPEWEHFLPRSVTEYD